MFNFLPCDSCAYDVRGCCDYDEPLGKYCVNGDAYTPRRQQISIFDILGEDVSKGVRSNV